MPGYRRKEAVATRARHARVVAKGNPTLPANTGPIYTCWCDSLSPSTRAHTCSTDEYITLSSWQRHGVGGAAIRRAVCFFSRLCFFLTFIFFCPLCMYVYACFLGCFSCFVPSLFFSSCYYFSLVCFLISEHDCVVLSSTVVSRNILLYLHVIVAGIVERTASNELLEKQRQRIASAESGSVEQNPAPPIII